MDAKQTNQTLENLILLNEDSDKGYKQAAEHIDHAEIKTVLLRLSQQRAQFMADLKDLSRELGGSPSDHSDGTITANLHRTWIDIKSKFQKDDTEAILNECKRGDSALIEAYETALSGDLPQFAKDKIISQHKLVVGAQQQLDEFKVNH